MEFVSKTVPMNFNLFLLGDVHLGTMLCHENGFKDALDKLESPYEGCKTNFAAGMGDYCEAIDHTDRRFDVFGVDTGKIRPDLQYEYFEELIRPYRKYFVCLLFGNHEYTNLKYFDYTRHICKNLDIPYGTMTAIVSFYNRKDELLFKSYLWHGNGNISSVADDQIRIESNMKLSLKRKLKNKAGDCALMALGHTHKLLIAEPSKTLYMTSNGEALSQNYRIAANNAPYIPPDHRWYVNTGSFRKAYYRGISDYAERAGYDPITLGYGVAKIRDGTLVGINKEYV